MRKPLLAGNWKMNGTIESSKDFIDNFEVAAELLEKREVAICPPSVLLSYWSAYLVSTKPWLKVGAQNVHAEPKGAYTGEISVSMLNDVGCNLCIVGHSERRAYFHETDQDVNRKMNALMDGGVLPVVCVGETLEQREAGKTAEVITSQINGSVLASADRDLSTIVVAYEPVWAIGTGKTASNEQAEEVCALIRGLLKAKLGEAAAESIRILYGGSMTPANVDGLMAQPNIDGGLVGGASLKPADFARIAGFIEA